LRKRDLDLFDELGLGRARIGLTARDVGAGLVASQVALAPQREFLLDGEKHLVLARPAGAVDLIRGDAQRRIGERAGDLDPRLRRFGIESAGCKVRAQPPRDRQYLVKRCPRRAQSNRCVGARRCREDEDQQHGERESGGAAWRVSRKPPRHVTSPL